MLTRGNPDSEQTATVQPRDSGSGGMVATDRKCVNPDSDALWAFSMIIAADIARVGAFVLGRDVARCLSMFASRRSCSKKECLLSQGKPVFFHRKFLLLRTRAGQAYELRSAHFIESPQLPIMRVGLSLHSPANIDWRELGINLNVMMRSRDGWVGAACESSSFPT